MTGTTSVEAVVAGPPLELVAQALEASGDYRVLRRVVAPPIVPKSLNYAGRVGVLLDCETTGLDPTKDEVIELAMVKFGYTVDGTIESSFGKFEALQQPSGPLPDRITKITGLTNDMVVGQQIDPRAVEAFVEDAHLVVAHNARFDRMFAEKCWQVFEHLPWACSASELDWRASGFAGANLAYLLAGTGRFHDGHRALADCHALLEVLRQPLAATGRPAFAHLLDRARMPSHRIWALHAPFDLRHVLKKRGYRWGDGSDGAPKAWSIDVLDEAYQDELRFLRDEVFRGDAECPVRRLTAHERFSVRANPNG